MIQTDTEEPTPVLVVGQEAAKGLADHLAEEWPVRLLSDDRSVVESADTESMESRHVEFNAAELEPHAYDADSAVIVAERDRAGLLIAQLLSSVCNVDRVSVRVDDPENLDAFEGLDCQVIETGPVLRSEVEQVLPRADS